MSTDKKAVVTPPNYSDADVAAIRAMSPINLEKAKILAEMLGKSWRSIIAKCGTEKIQYFSKPKPVKKVTPITKSELARRVSVMLERDLTGLEKTTSAVLLKLINGIEHILPPVVDPEPPEIGDSTS